MRHSVTMGGPLTHVAEGWSRANNQVLTEFVQRLGELLNANMIIKDVEDNILYVVANFRDIYLNGMHDVPCLLITGNDEHAAETIHRFWQTIYAPGRLPFVLALSNTVWQQSCKVLPSKRCLLLSPDDLGQLFEAQYPRATLLGYLRDQIPKRQLIPYDYLHPAEGEMFFGRRSELERLSSDVNTSFAIAGPGRIGKTSLVKQFQRAMLVRGDPAHFRRFYIDLYPCSGMVGDELARFVATRIADIPLSRRVTAAELSGFMKYQRNLHGGPLELLLDEVDGVCQTDTFKYLGAAAKDGHCRLVLCGRGNLLKTALSSSSPLECRLELMRLEPLDKDTATQMILRPFADLGIGINSDSERLPKLISRLTGRQPHLIQFLCKKLANQAIDAKKWAIGVEDVYLIRDQFDTMQYFTSSLQNLISPETRLVAFIILQERAHRPYTVGSILELLEKKGLRLAHEATLSICNDLVINNVLVWKPEGYAIANEALPDYAERLGYLNQGLQDAWRQWKEY